MGSGEHQGKQRWLEDSSSCPQYTWEEVQKHNYTGDQWLVIERKVYNVSEWTKRHPGGSRVLEHYAGEDATDAFMAFHPDLHFVRKFMKPLLLGELAASEPSQDHGKNASLVEDFQALRKQLEAQGLFRTSPMFFILCLGHILLLEAVPLVLLWKYGNGWIIVGLTAVMLATAQAQAGWLQHDLGHLSVFKKSTWDHLAHKFVIGHLKFESVCQDFRNLSTGGTLLLKNFKGASANWWNHQHFQHHSKPNVFTKDPDLNTLDILVLGNIQPVEYGIKKLKHMPYNHQHNYFFMIGPPLLIPVFFSVHIFRTLCLKRDWVDFVWYLSYYTRFFSCYVPYYGFLGSVLLQTFMRFLESHWYVWVTQMNHIPMDIDYERHEDWLTMQLKATCNVEQSFFNDWFTGHLNFQIEHHVFPTMPRHNYVYVAPLLRKLCEKYGVPYQVKGLWEAMSDIIGHRLNGMLLNDVFIDRCPSLGKTGTYIRTWYSLWSLRTSGELWLDAYLHK